MSKLLVLLLMAPVTLQLHDNYNTSGISMVGSIVTACKYAINMHIAVCLGTDGRLSACLVCREWLSQSKTSVIAFVLLAA